MTPTPTPAAPAVDPKPGADDALYRLRRVERSLAVVSDLLLQQHEAAGGRFASLHLVEAGDMAFLLELASDEVASALPPLEQAVAAAILAGFTTRDDR